MAMRTHTIHPSHFKDMDLSFPHRHKVSHQSFELFGRFHFTTNTEGWKHPDPPTCHFLLVDLDYSICEVVYSLLPF